MKWSRIQSLHLTNVWMNRYKLQLTKRGYILCAEGGIFNKRRRRGCFSTCYMRCTCRMAPRLIRAGRGFLGRVSSPKRLNGAFAIVTPVSSLDSVALFVPLWSMGFFPQKHVSVFPPLLSFSVMADPCSFQVDSASLWILWAWTNAWDLVAGRGFELNL